MLNLLFLQDSKNMREEPLADSKSGSLTGVWVQVLPSVVTDSRTIPEKIIANGPF